MTLSYPRIIIIYRSILTAILILFGLSQLPAQLSGVYKIGGYNPHYTTIKEAVSHLRTEGVSGPVRFDIRRGLYAEQVSLPRIWGSSWVNTITFQSESGNADDVIIRYLPSRNEEQYIFTLDNARHYRLINLRLESVIFGGVIKMVNEAYDLRIEGCKLYSPDVVSGRVEHAVIYLSPSKATSVHIRGNDVQGGAYGINFYMNPGAYSAGTQITDNVISRYYHSGVIISNLSGGKFTGNKIIRGSYIPDTANGLTISGWNGTTQRPVLIANNFVDISNGNQSAVGIFNCNNLHFLNNSLRQVNDQTVFRISRTQAAAVFNNIFRGGTGYSVFISENSSLRMDYNDLLTDGPYLARIESSNATSLDSWKRLSGHDYFSISVDPQFYRGLHAKSTSLVGAGVAQPDVYVDIDGQPRNNPPCIGADEFKKCPDYLFWPTPCTFPYLQSDYNSGGVDMGIPNLLSKINAPERLVFPNPVVNDLTVLLNDGYTGPVTFTVLDGMGRRVSQMDYEKEGADLRVEFLVQHLTPGVYQLQITEGQEVSVERFVKR